MQETQPGNPLHDVTLEQLLNGLVSGLHDHQQVAGITPEDFCRQDNPRHSATTAGRTRLQAEALPDGGAPGGNL